MKKVKVVGYPQVLGQVIRLRRKALSISQGTLGRAVGLSASGWSRVETGDTSMEIKHLRGAARVLGVSPHELVREADELCERFGGLDVEVLDGVVSIHDALDDRLPILGETLVALLVLSRKPSSDSPAAEPCTGLSASWCPNCGDCSCPTEGGERSLCRENCPLHGASSPHGE